MKLEGATLKEQVNILSKEIGERLKRLQQEREYKRHHTIITLDLTQSDKYGIPNLSLSGKGSTLAYPHKVRVHVKTKYEGKMFEVDIGGFTIIQTRS